MDFELGSETRSGSRAGGKGDLDGGGEGWDIWEVERDEGNDASEVRRLGIVALALFPLPMTLLAVVGVLLLEVRDARFEAIAADRPV